MLFKTTLKVVLDVALEVLEVALEVLEVLLELLVAFKSRLGVKSPNTTTTTTTRGGPEIQQIQPRAPPNPPKR